MATGRPVAAIPAAAPDARAKKGAKQRFLASRKAKILNMMPKLTKESCKVVNSYISSTGFSAQRSPAKRAGVLFPKSLREIPAIMTAPAAPKRPCQRTCHSTGWTPLFTFQKRKT